MPDDLHILYFEGNPNAKKFVEGAFGHAGFSWERASTMDRHALDRADVVYLSDFPASRLTDSMQHWIRDAVSQGTGLVMTGGWFSFGRGGYHEGPIGDILPVTVQGGDDRRHNVQGAYPRLRPDRSDHPILHGLDLRRPPVFCGHNQVTARDGAHVLLEVAAIEATGDDLRLVPDGDLLVVGHHDSGRVVAYASDLAPHWSGGVTDWGGKMLQAPKKEELGDQYVRFVENLFRWAGNA